MYKRPEKDGPNIVWNIPANSLVIPVAGEVSISGKVYRPGDCYMPKVFDGAVTRTIKAVPKQGSIILDLPFAKYAIINAKWRSTPGVSGELL